MHESALLYNYLIIGAILIGIGGIGFLVRRNMIVVFLAVEMMLQGVSLSLVAWGRFHNDWSGQMLVLFMVAVAACEAAIGLALILALALRGGKLDLALLQDLREEGQPAFVDREVPEEREAEAVWPRLTPAGVQPQVDDREFLYRSRV